MCSGSSPLSATIEVMAMRIGSKIANEIIEEQREEKAIKAKLLREVYRKRKERGVKNDDDKSCK